MAQKLGARPRCAAQKVIGCLVSKKWIEDRFDVCHFQARAIGKDGRLKKISALDQPDFLTESSQVRKVDRQS